MITGMSVDRRERMVNSNGVGAKRALISTRNTGMPQS